MSTPYAQHAVRWIAGLWACLLGVVLPARATHIVGGQMGMEHLSGTTYTLQLTLYFDVINGAPGALDQTASIGVYKRGDPTLHDTYDLPLISQTPVVYTSPNCQGGQLSTDELVYELTVNLDPGRYDDSAGYYLVWERCCRNGVISNLLLPGDTGQSFYLEFPALRRNGQPFINSSPQGFLPVNAYACVGQPFSSPFGGTDPDGDSLVYELGVPLAGHADRISVMPQPPLPAPYARVQWAAGFDSLHQITGPMPLRVNAQTGEISFTASQTGLYVFSVVCNEYRAGVWIGQVRREFQELIVNCPGPQPPALTLKLPGQPGNYVPGTLVALSSITASCLTLRVTDPDTLTTLRLRIAPVGATGLLPTLSVTGGVIHTPGRPDTLVSQLCFPACSSTNGQPIALNLIAEDNACPIPHRDTVRLLVNVTPPPVRLPTLRLLTGSANTSYVVKPGDTLTFGVQGLVPDNFQVTAEAIGLTAAPLARLPISCPPVQAAGVATTRLTWPIGCDVTPGQYTLHLRASTTDPCAGLQQADSLVQVTVGPPDPLVILPPNIFTPNADGLNDTFAPAAGPVPPCSPAFRQLRIFNRWGRQVFTSTIPGATWNGAGAGEGMYYYFLEYADRTYKGWVELVR